MTYSYTSFKSNSKQLVAVHIQYRSTRPPAATDVLGSGRIDGPYVSGERQTTFPGGHCVNWPTLGIQDKSCFF